MITHVTHLTLLVENQEQALDFYIHKLGFKLHTDALFESMRWLTIHAENQPEFEIILALASTDYEKSLVGKQAGSRPLISIQTTDCQQEYERLSKLGVTFVDKPEQHPWGIGASFNDLYGNTLYLVQVL